MSRNVPEHWDWNGVVGTGQSLAVGVGGTPLRATEPSYRNLKLDLGNRFFRATSPDSGRLSLVPLCEPIRPLTSGYPRPFPVNVYGETPHTAMASQITALVLKQQGDDDYVTVHSVVGESGQPLNVIGKGAADTGNTGKAYQASLFELRAITRLAKQAGRSFGLGAVVLTHGESDAENAGYEQGLLRLWRDYAADAAAITGQKSEPRLLVTQQASSPPRAGTLAGSALAALAACRAEPDHLTCVGPRYQYSYAPDGVHLDPLGYDRLGEKYGQIYFERAVMGGQWRPLAPRSVSRAEGRVIIEFDVPVTPLVWDESLPAPHAEPGHPWASGRGFELTADGAPARIEAVEAQTRAVVLHTRATGKLLVRYAASAAAKPRPGGSWRWGQLRDSDPFVGVTTRTPQPNYAVTFELEVP